MTTSEVKALLRITTTEYNTYLDAAIPLLVDFVKSYCNNTFLDADGNESIPPGVKIAIANMAQFNMQEKGIQSESEGSHSVTFETDFPQSIIKLLRPYKKVKFI